MDTEGLGDLEEPDQLEPVQTLGPGLVAMNLRQSRVHGGVGGDEAVDVREPEQPSYRMHHRCDRGVHQPGFPELANVELNMGAPDHHQRVQIVGLAPREPALQLVRVQVVGVPGVPGRIRHHRELGGDLVVGWNGRNAVGPDMKSPHAAT